MTSSNHTETLAVPPLALDFDTLSDDAFLGGALQLLQPKAGFRAGIDAVLLGASVPAQVGGVLRPIRVLDVGAGVGTAGMCVARRVSAAKVVLVEKNRELVRLAQENCKRNKLDGRVEVVASDICSAALEIDAVGLVDQSFDYVLANPPFFTIGEGTSSSSKLKSHANEMHDSELDQWLRFMARMTKAGGVASVIHKASALDRLLGAMRGRFGGIRVLPIHPREGTVANRILVTGIKGSKAELKISPGLALHSEGHSFTDRVDAILRKGNGFEIAG